MSTATSPLLTLQGVTRTFVTRRTLLGKPRERVQAVSDVSLEVGAGATLGIVGESGSGKSTLGRLALGLAEADSGEIQFDGANLRTLGARELRTTRQQLGMIFQDPFSALDPRWTVERLVGEPLGVKNEGDADHRRQQVIEMLRRVGLDEDVLHRTPRAFSGGQRQRIVIARALITRPRVVFCDEPVSALDVSTRAQVLLLLQELQREFGLAYLFVSHDLGVVQSMSDRIAVMYLGRVVEIGDANSVASEYRHPYTACLVSAAPAADPLVQRDRKRLVLAGDPPSAVAPPPGCPFHPRCALAMPICSEQVPPLTPDEHGHAVACHVTGADHSLVGVNLFDRMTARETPSREPSPPPARVVQVEGNST